MERQPSVSYKQPTLVLNSHTHTLTTHINTSILHSTHIKSIHHIHLSLYHTKHDENGSDPLSPLLSLPLNPHL